MFFFGWGGGGAILGNRLAQGGVGLNPEPRALNSKPRTLNSNPNELECFFGGGKPSTTRK